MSSSELEQIIIKIVKFEGPIYIEELIQRIKVHFRITRVGNNIRNIICFVIKSAEQSKEIVVKDDFLWPSSGTNNLLRRRSGASSVKIEWICDEEIIQAIDFILGNQYSTSSVDLVRQASSILGIKVVRQNAKDRIENIIRSLIRDNHLTKLPNNMIYFQQGVTG